MQPLMLAALALGVSHCTSDRTAISLSGKPVASFKGPLCSWDFCATCPTKKVSPRINYKLQQVLFVNQWVDESSLRAIYAHQIPQKIRMGLSEKRLQYPIPMVNHHFPS